LARRLARHVVELMHTDHQEIAAQPTNDPSGHRRIALVTGGTDGIGKAIARVLAKEGIGVVVVGSNAEKGAAAVRELRQTSGNADIEFLGADLSLIRNVDILAAEVSKRWLRLHYLVLCAGIVRGRHTLTSEGIETNFAINYLSRFALTEKLLDNLAADGRTGEAARVLVVSGAAQDGKIQYDDVNLTDRFGIVRALSQFCEANDVFVLELARRLAAAAPSPLVTVTVLKVGAVRTNIRSQFPSWMKLLVPLVVDPFLSQTTTQIAASARHLLLDPMLEGVSGAMFRHIKQFKALKAGPRTSDPAEGRRLWALSEQLAAQARAANASRETKS
jgi:NAD(P)-dependent dehydrogenase (short-subunit alcohol dehydrogenase family)